MPVNSHHAPNHTSDTDLLGALLAKRKTDGLTFGHHRLQLSEVVREVAEHIGIRRAGSMGELRTSAYMSSIWHKAGLLTWTDSFDAKVQRIPTTMYLAILSVGANICASFSVNAALVITSVLLGFAVWIQYRDMPLVVGKRMTIPNVIAIRKTAEAPRRRVVIIAPLDTNGVVDRFNQPWQHVVAVSVQAASLLIAILDTAPLVRLLPLGHLTLGWVMWGCSGFFIVTAIIEAQSHRRTVTSGAVSHAGGLAVEARIVDELDALRHTEVWAVSTGASQTYAGVDDLIQRYPFDPHTTFFVVLSGIGRGTLCYTIPAGGTGGTTDPLLLELATEVRKTVGVDARVSRNPSVIRPLLKRNYRAIEFTCLDEKGYVPLQGLSSDSIEVLSLPILERAVRAVVMMIRALDALN